MAIFRCNKCTHIQEQSDGQVGETVVCPRCGNPAPVYGTLFFIGRLLDKYFEAQRELARLTNARIYRTIAARFGQIARLQIFR